MMIKNVKFVELNISIAIVFFEYTSFKDNLIEYKCLYCNKNVCIVTKIVYISSMKN